MYQSKARLGTQTPERKHKHIAGTQNAERKPERKNANAERTERKHTERRAPERKRKNNANAQNANARNAERPERNRNQNANAQNARTERAKICNPRLTPGSPNPRTQINRYTTEDGVACRLTPG